MELSTENIIRYGLTLAVLFFILGVFLEANIRAVLEEHGWDKFLLRASRKVHLLKEYRVTWLAMGLLAGAALASWIAPAAISGGRAETSTATHSVANSPDTKPPASARPKAVLDELKAESGALLKIVEEQLIPIEHDWRVQLGGKNPERLCIDLDGNELLSQISNLANRVQNATNGISVALKESGIDQDEMRSLMGYPSTTHPLAGQSPSLVASLALKNYSEIVRGLGDKPTCQEIVTKNVAGQFFNMTSHLNSFNDWTVKSQQRLQKYQEDIQREARGAP